jgi:hypothetical protein
LGGPFVRLIIVFDPIFELAVSGLRGYLPRLRERRASTSISPEFRATNTRDSIYCALHKIRKRYPIAAMAALPNNLPFAVCARCGEVMPLIRTVARAGALPEMRVFVCNFCGEVETMGIPQQAQTASPTAKVSGTDGRRRGNNHQ